MRQTRLLVALLCLAVPIACRHDDGQPEPHHRTHHARSPQDRAPSQDGGQPADDDVPTSVDASDAASGAPAEVDASAPAPAASEDPAASSALPRLTHHQWALAAQQLLQLPAAPDVSHFVTDPATASGFDNLGGNLDVSPDLWKDYQSASERVAQDVAANPDQLKKLGLEPAGSAFVTALVERAFRRPPTQPELKRYLDLFASAPTLLPGRDAANAGAELVITALLQSPHFVYRPELDNLPDEHGNVQLSDHEIAARLSFALWDSPPDEALAAAARAGMLHDADSLLAQAKRMLEAPPAADKLLDFHKQWLGLAAYETMKLDDQAVGATLYDETERFVRDVVYEHDGSLSDLLLADFTYVNKVNAPLYDLTDASSFGDELQRVTLDATKRRGFLMQAGFLAAHSGATAPILRGVFIVRKLLCSGLPPPPKFGQQVLQGTTRRERVNSITGPGTCGAGCHATMINPAGFPFEYFDDSGRYRTTDSGEPVDGSGSYTFASGTVSYTSPVEWASILAQSREAHDCYARQWLQYGLGRLATDADAPLIARLGTASRADNASIKQLLLMLVKSPSFTARRMEAQ